MATELKQQIRDVRKDELNQFFDECVSFLPRLLDRGVVTSLLSRVNF